VYNKAVANGAKVVAAPHVLEDEHGKVKLASIRTYGDTVHTLVERAGYRGPFLPGYTADVTSDPISQFLPDVSLECIDHCVGNQDWDQMEAICE
jgi:4-hydroxyphenylpyruvate dioxygenase